MDSSVYLCRCDWWNVTQSECFRPFPRLLAVFPFLHCYVDSIWLNLTQLHGRSAFFRTFEADCLWCWYLCSQPSSSPSSFCSRILETGELGKVFISWHLIGRYVETVGVPIKFGLWASRVSTRYPGESAGCWDESFTYQRPPWVSLPIAKCCHIKFRFKVHSNTRICSSSQVYHDQIQLLW